jgi:hypothetical protein
MNKYRPFINFTIIIIQYIIVIGSILDNLIFSGYLTYLFYEFENNETGDKNILLFLFILYWLFYFLPYFILGFCNLKFIKGNIELNFDNWGISFSHCFRFVDLLIGQYIVNITKSYLNFTTFRHILIYKVSLLVITIFLQPTLIGIIYLINRTSIKINPVNRTNIILVSNTANTLNLSNTATSPQSINKMDSIEIIIS